LQILLREEVAVILLDVNMPLMDGFETAALIREHPRFENIPIIFVTGVNTTEMDRLKGYGLGAVDYVYVPVIPEILRAKVAVFVELFRKNRELVTLNRELERRVGERTADLAVLNEELDRRVRDRTAELQEVNRQLEAFSYSVSHDLRAPLRHIAGFVDLLAKRIARTVDDEARQYFHDIDAAVKQAQTLIDELLRFSRLSRAELRFAGADLNRVLEEARSDVAGEASGRSIRWTIESLPHVRADASMLRLVFRNLLSNAIKYTRPREEAAIEVGCRVESHHTVVFVRDNGVGFDMSQVDRLFGVFQRLHSREQFEGVGIGLASVRQIIQRHGGRTWAESETGHGATVSFSLPSDPGGDV
jgi:two-component system sensor histidine kinase/response regulator